MRYFVYMSPVKVDMLYSQISSVLTKKLAGELKVSVGVVSATLKSHHAEPGEVFAKARIVEEYLDREGVVGSLEYPGSYIRDVLELRGGVLYDYAAGIAFFGGEGDGVTLALIGSSESLVGALSKQEAHSLDYYELKFIGEALDGSHGQPSPASEDDRYYDAAVRAARIALKEVKGRPRKYEFLARVLYDAGDGAERIVVATPLFVALAD